MIIVKLVGGLGNQLFQYATARSISLRKGVEFKLDNNVYKESLGHNILRYKLNRFNVIENFATDEEIKKYSNEVPVSFFQRAYNFFLTKKLNIPNRYNKKSHLIERFDDKIDGRIIDCRDGMYLEGWFGKEAYFRDFRSELERDLSLKNPPASENQKLLEKIENCNSVSVHMRRGDIAAGIHNSFFRLLPLSYYEEALKIITDRVKDPVFYIFSDSIDWVKENFKIDWPIVYVDNNGDREYEDLNLMMHCKNHIIANSTFSYWGAWLGDRPDHVVVAPETWYNDAEANAKVDHRLMYPEHWVLV